MLVVKRSFVIKLPRTLMNRRIVCVLCAIAVVVYGIVYYNSSFRMRQESKSLRPDMTVGHSSKEKQFAKATFLRIKETFSKIKKEFRRAKKRFSTRYVNSQQQFKNLSYPENLFLLVLVPSLPNAMISRIAVRLSWARNRRASKRGDFTDGRTYRVLFVIREQTESRNSLTQESKKFEDILQLAKQDGDRDISNMIVPAIDHIRSLKCEPKFVLALAGDTFVNIPEVVSWLSMPNQNVKYVGNVEMARSTSDDDVEIPYCVEGAYILAGEILPGIVNASRVILPSNHDKNEAMYVGKLAHSLGIKPHHDARFKPRLFDDLNIRDINPCSIKKVVFVHHVFRIRHILLHSKATVVGKQPCVT
ncbi:UDP-GalNAc:beta-1,3-N-acetylgalactosaminyltransferase 1-like [Dendronephthya gigantea]|uniref:UDP-GalNAc:beta-1, 3-N-acetylgalactosaminyltransferase 1-like n=1 Tax=Dendronephthya gigantea TaxID=151771 RepID=UPI00106AD7F7|nr:UDP-GalNAc:beta-1,3-N-acetylgalactosaminyltransferase 1-like [Dendronephthya gigantea]